MTITFPRQLPTNSHMQECWFDLVENVVGSPSGKNNKINLSEISDPTWKGTFLTGILERDDHRLWSAWHKSLRGGLRQFIAYDVRKARPYAYGSVNSPGEISGGWDGTASVTALGVSGALSLATLPAGYQFKIGDRVGLEQSGHYGYYEVMEDVAANGSGVVTVSVAPFLHTGLFTTSAVCRVWRAMCQFIIDENTWNEMGTVENTPIQFSGIQRL